MPALRRTRENITRAAALAAVAGTCAAVALPADAARRPSVYQSPLLWATVNACDTADKPNTIGIRASMPGSGFTKERMFVRLQVQYVSALDGKWHNVGEGGDSGWLPLGSGRFRARQAGTDFTFKAPDAGRTLRLRGAATFEWRVGDDVVRRARKRTEAGHPGTRGSSPPGFSAATCDLR
jgi:hypothetical protein